MGKHTLTDAVVDGTITEWAASCGIRAEDVERLCFRYAEALVLVRLRTAYADGRTVMSVAELARWTRGHELLVADGQHWKNKDIRDVLPISLTADMRRWERARFIALHDDRNEYVALQ